MGGIHQERSARPKIARGARNRQLVYGFNPHLEQTKQHAKRLEQILKGQGASTRGPKCEGMDELIISVSKRNHPHGVACVIPHGSARFPPATHSISIGHAKILHSFGARARARLARRDSHAEEKRIPDSRLCPREQLGRRNFRLRDTCSIQKSAQAADLRGPSSPGPDQRASPRIPPNRRAALVDSDFFAPLCTPTLFPPVWIFSPGRDGTDWVPGFRCGCIVFLPAIPLIRARAPERAHDNEISSFQLHLFMFGCAFQSTMAGPFNTRSGASKRAMARTVPCLPGAGIGCSHQSVPSLSYRYLRYLFDKGDDSLLRRGIVP